MYLRNHPVEGDSCLKQGFWRRLCLTASVNASLSLFHISKAMRWIRRVSLGRKCLCVRLFRGALRSKTPSDRTRNEKCTSNGWRWTSCGICNMQNVTFMLIIWSTFCVYGLKIFVSLEKLQFYDVYYSSGPWIRSNSSLLYHCSVASSRRNLILHSHDNYNNNI